MVPVASTTPVSAFRKVVLPLPFGPTSPRISLSCSDRLTPSTATTPPNCTRMSSASMTDRGVGLPFVDATVDRRA